MIWDAGGNPLHYLIHQAFLNASRITIEILPPSELSIRAGELEQETAERAALCQQSETNNSNFNDYEPSSVGSSCSELEIESGNLILPESYNLCEQTKVSEIPNCAEILTTRQAWELAKARGYTKSKDTFRNWSKRSFEKCQEMYGLIVVRDSQDGTLVGYQDLPLIWHSRL